MEFKNLQYSPQTGMLYKVSRRKPKLLPQVSKNYDGYYATNYYGKSLLVHRLIYMMMTDKEIPEGMQIDHINGNKTDNRWCNLRLVDNRQNVQAKNLRLYPDQLVGATKLDNGKYTSKIWHNDRKVTLGRFETEYDCHCAYMNYMDDNNIPYLKEIDRRKI